MRTLLTALALFCAVNLSAADLKWAMKTQAGDVVFMTDVSYLLYGDGATTFSIVRKDGSTIANVEKVTFEKLDPTGVGAVVNDNEVFAKIVERTLTIAGCEAGIEAAVVNVGCHIRHLLCTCNNSRRPPSSPTGHVRCQDSTGCALPNRHFQQCNSRCM